MYSVIIVRNKDPETSNCQPLKYQHKVKYQHKGVKAKLKARGLHHLLCESSGMLYMLYWDFWLKYIVDYCIKCTAARGAVSLQRYIIYTTGTSFNSYSAMSVQCKINL
jgi:hypothetical protein